MYCNESVWFYGLFNFNCENAKIVGDESYNPCEIFTVVHITS